jgi:hypothetical protein
MIEKTHRRAADPTLVAAIRAHKAALAAGAAPRRRFTFAMAPRVPSPPEPPPAPTPPEPTPPPPDPTPDTGTTVPTGSPFTPDGAAAIYKAREAVTRRVGVDRMRALDPTGTRGDVPPPSTPPRRVPVRWPDHETVYAARRRDVERARSARRRE